MSLLLSGPAGTEWKTLTSSSATVVFTAPSRTTVVQIGATETNGGTQTLSIFILRADGSTTYYLRKTRAAVAKERALIDEVIVLNKGDAIKATSSDASGYFDISVTYLLPDATGAK